MKRSISVLFAALSAIMVSAQTYSEFFTEKTLRIDYIFQGSTEQQVISLDKLSSFAGWSGRRQRLSELPLQGNGQIIMYDSISNQRIYATSFSSLFQEWLETEEAGHTARSFENTFLLPYPRNTVVVEVMLLSPAHAVTTRMRHVVRPDDILIQSLDSSTPPTPHKYLLQNSTPEQCIDIAILAEGYTPDEMEMFYQDAEVAYQSIFEHEPFRSMQKHFNVVAVGSPSLDSGVSIPRLKEWKKTAFSSHFSTFYSDRYLTTRSVKSIHDALQGIPYEHIIILANTDEYGGGGIYNAYTLTTAHHPLFRPVVVHEFGHSFGGLADEYFYEEDIMNDLYPLNVEPWEQNITTLVDFDAKWKDLLDAHTPAPTPAAEKKKHLIGVYEGGGYSTHGIYRPAYNCRMRTNSHPDFCPVCQRALKRLIEFYVP